MPVYIYGCYMRPPDPGAIPREGIYYVIYCDDETSPQGRHLYGKAVYTRLLEIQEVIDYELEFIEKREV